MILLNDLISYLLKETKQVTRIIHLTDHKSNVIDNFEKILSEKYIGNIYYDTRKISINSRKSNYNKKILNGFIFIKGKNYNPYNNLELIISNGINLLFIELLYLNDVIDRLKNIKEKNKSFYIILSKNNRFLLAWIIKYLYKFIDSDFFICGVTGTNGKTTIVHILNHVFNSINEFSASIGTIGINYKNKSYEEFKIKIERTTPEVYDIFDYLKLLKKEGIKNIFIEISSIASVLGRVASISFDSIVFTNMTEDHLDFHKTLENYYNAKLDFIDLLQRSNKKGKILVFNHDDPKSVLIMERLKKIEKKVDKLSFFIVTYGKKDIDDFYKKNKIYKKYLLFNVFISSINTKSGYMRVKYEIKSDKKKIFKNFEIISSIIGDYNAYNIAAALAILYMKKVSFDIIGTAFKNIYIPGRLEKIKFKGNDIYVDYAHTEDALENVLLTLKNSNYNYIITLFGCGGDREKEKREKMGEVADKYSDFIVLTNDNPRNENENEIIQMILKGIKNKAKVIIELERELAIKKAINKLNKLKNSCLLIAGKGHETYQEIKGEKKYFSDKEQVLKNIKEINKI